MENINGKIYLITNNVTNERYIGQTINSVEGRFNAHKQGTRQPKKFMSKLQKAMDLYGKPNFKIETIIKGINNIDELAILEKYYIKKLGTEAEYNSTSGGESNLRGSKTLSEYIELQNTSYVLEIFNKLSSFEVSFLLLLLIFSFKKEQAHFSEIKKILKRSTIGNTTLIDTSQSITTKLKNFDFISSFNLNKNELYFDLKTTTNPIRITTTRRKSSFSFVELLNKPKKYSKLMFLLIKSKSKKNFYISTSTLFSILNSPYSSTRLLNDKIIKPSLLELNVDFPTLKIKKRIQSKKIVGYEFLF